LNFRELSIKKHWYWFIGYLKTSSKINTVEEIPIVIKISINESASVSKIFDVRRKLCLKNQKYQSKLLAALFLGLFF